MKLPKTRGAFFGLTHTSIASRFVEVHRLLQLPRRDLRVDLRRLETCVSAQPAQLLEVVMAAVPCYRPRDLSSVSLTANRPNDWLSSILSSAACSIACWPSLTRLG